MLSLKIGMMGAWNLDAGSSVHAELIGREWVRKGHDLRLYSYLHSDFHGTTFVGEDESYVTRCFRVSGYLDPRPILNSDHDIFVVQNLGMLPRDGLRKIFHCIRKKARTVNIIHEAELPSDPSFYQFQWESIVCFDQRYRKFLREAFPEEKIHVIPFPCHPIAKGNKAEARLKLALPLNCKILLVFGQHVEKDLELLQSISTLGIRYPILLLVVSIHAPNRIVASNIQVDIRNEAPNIGRLYDYLHASDALILNRQVETKAVVSSTAHQCLGSGCPIMALDSPFFKNFHKEILKYRTADEFEACLIEVMESGNMVMKTIQAAEEYARKNTAEKIAERYIELFQKLLTQSLTTHGFERHEMETSTV